MEAQLAYEDDMIVGVFIDKPMSDAWKDEKPSREIYAIPVLDKSFAKMAVEYNTKYEQ